MGQVGEFRTYGPLVDALQGRLATGLAAAKKAFGTTAYFERRAEEVHCAFDRFAESLGL